MAVVIFSLVYRLLSDVLALHYLMTVLISSWVDPQLLRSVGWYESLTITFEHYYCYIAIDEPYRRPCVIYDS